MNRSRILVAVASLALLLAYAFPIWRIHLEAPQYPEGLGMNIEAGTITGMKRHDLANINNLNHYIGMKRIEPESIKELELMPWIIGVLALTGLLVAATGSRKLLYAWTVVFFLFAVAGLVDFWLWEYDYGHNLDAETAAIKIPGMSYQPPLIGSKQILNFTATSWPGIGGWAAIASFLTGASAMLTELRRRRAEGSA